VQSGGAYASADVHHGKAARLEGTCSRVPGHLQDERMQLETAGAASDARAVSKVAVVAAAAAAKAG